jgi:hypothetical protein
MSQEAWYLIISNVVTMLSSIAGWFKSRKNGVQLDAVQIKAEEVRKATAAAVVDTSTSQETVSSQLQDLKSLVVSFGDRMRTIEDLISFYRKRFPVMDAPLDKGPA